MEIKVRDFLGDTVAVEDAIVLRDYMNQYINEPITLDFEGYDKIPTTFLNCLFSDLINGAGRDYIINNINVKNISNYNDYSRVVMGTTFS